MCHAAYCRETIVLQEHIYDNIKYATRKANKL